MEFMMTEMNLDLESSVILFESLYRLPAATTSLTPVFDIPDSYKDGFEDEYNNMADIIEFLETLWLEDADVRKEIKEKDWEEFMESVYHCFYMIEDAYILELKSEQLKAIRQ